MYLSAISSRLLLYDQNSWDLKKTYSCYDGILRDISWSDDSKYLLQVNAKGLIEILSPADHDVRSLQHIPLKDTWSASFHRDGHRNIAIGTKSGNVMIWDTKNKTITKTFPTPSQQSSVNYVSYNAKNTSLAATMRNGDTVIYGLVSNIPVLTVKLTCSKSISAMKFHHESRSMLGLATDEGHLVLRDITTNKDKVFFENIHAAPVSDFAYSLVNRDVMLSSGYDKIMHVYDVRLQNVVSTIRTSHFLTSIAINPENQVALGTKDGTVLIYDLRDLTATLKVLKSHDEEICKVAFQPNRKKLYSAEVSLREETENNGVTLKMSSPTRNRASDWFFAGSDLSPKPDSDAFSPGQDENKDSFLAMLGLDSSKNAIDEDNKASDLEKRNDKFEVRHSALNTERNISKVSTPVSGKTPENLNFVSPKCAPINNFNIPQSNSNAALPAAKDIEIKAVEELKDFVKLTISDVADDNRNYFLHIMMALTKQKLFLEKQLLGMNQQIKSLILNQNTLLEINRQLILELEQLKSKHN